jgi:hypothetical protein
VVFTHCYCIGRFLAHLRAYTEMGRAEESAVILPLIADVSHDIFRASRIQPIMAYLVVSSGQFWGLISAATWICTLKSREYSSILINL